MSQAIPPIGTKGRYELNAPWQAKPTVIYTCGAIRSFTDLENLGTRVYETYYAPRELDRSVYEQDRRDRAVIVTLLSDSEAPIYVPSSHIAAFPDLSYRNYHHVVLSASLGMLPDYIDLTFARQQVAATLSEVVGKEVEVFVNVAAHDGVISPDQHEALEAARQAAIENRTTDRARVLDLQAQNQSLAERLQILETLVKDNGLIPE